MGKKIVNIFCITYNQVLYIRDALDGFLKQKTNFEYNVFVYDDASTDGTTEVLLEYQKNYPDIFRIYISERNRWKDKDRKDFIHKLKLDNLDGKYIALCEGDDYWIDENKLQTQVDYMEAHQKCSLYIHNCLWLDCTNNTFREADTFDIADEGDVDVDELILEKNAHPATASFMYRSKLHNEPSFFFNSSVGDYTVLLLAAANGKVHYNSKAMSVYRSKSQGSYTNMLISDLNVNTYYYLGLISFLVLYNNYTKGKFKVAVCQKLLSFVTSFVSGCARNKITAKERYKLCIEQGYNLSYVSESIINKLDKLYVNETSGYISEEIKKFISKYSRIIVMGTGVYSELLTEQLKNNNIEFAGYAKTVAEPNETHNGKKVWKLSEIPFDKNRIGILVGILILNKNDIINSLKNAQIANYYMPFDYEDSILELLKE